MPDSIEETSFQSRKHILLKKATAVAETSNITFLAGVNFLISFFYF